MAPGVKKSCTSCQQQHLKCNLVRPICGACIRNSRGCHWVGDFSFCHDSNPSIQAGAVGTQIGFAYMQKWVDIPRDLHFVDETREMQLTYTESWNGESLECDEKSGINSSSTQLKVPSTSSEPEMSISTRKFSPQNLRGEASSSLPVPQVHIDLGIENRRVVLQHKALMPLRLQKGQYCGLQDEQEVRLLRYFIDKLSSWFDICDPEKHFATVVPRRAVTYPTLLNAICAVSARHMSRTTDFDPLIANQFYQTCLSTLIPALNNDNLLKDENVFSAVVILRLFEELEGSHNQSHMLGIQVLLDAQDYTEASSGLGQAAFHVAMRQEIGMAFLHQRPILPKVMQGIASLSLSPACEGDWAYRSSIYCAVVLEFCYGSEVRTLEKWQELVDYGRQWLELRPQEFEPIYLDDSGVAEFPTICYLDSIHVATANNHTLARILLLTHDPHILDIIERRTQDEIVQEEIGNYIRELCGTAFSNVQTAIAMLSASVGIALVGSKISEYKTQVLLLDFLIRTEKQHGWSTMTARQKLVETWGCSNEFDKYKSYR